MKLFSSKQISDIKREQQDKEVARGLKIASLVKDEQKKLEDIQVTKEQTAKTIQEEFTTLLDSLNSKRASLEQDVTILEQRKAEALKPVEDLQKALQLQKKTFDALEVDFNTQDAQLREKEARMQREFSELSSLKDRMQAERERFDLKLLNLKAQENAVNEGYKTLQQQWASFTDSTAESATLISSWETELAQKEQAFYILQNEIKEHKKDIELNRIRLVDLQDTIRAAFAEAREKNLL